MLPHDDLDEQRQTCMLLGLNVNGGQEIKLRLRTDDLLGFRNYNKIRDTLVHELTHNVWGDHDNKFKELNSRLLREVVRIHRERTAGLALLRHGAEVRTPWILLYASSDPPHVTLLAVLIRDCLLVALHVGLHLTAVACCNVVCLVFAIFWRQEPSGS